MGPPYQKITAQITCLKEHAGNLRVKKDSCSDEDDCSFGSGGNSSLAIAVKFDMTIRHHLSLSGKERPSSYSEAALCVRSVLYAYLLGIRERG